MHQNPTQARIYTFWSWLLENQAELAGEHSELAELLDELLEELHLVDPGLYFEIESTTRPRELVLTAEGHEELFPLVESLVASAPSLEGWEFTALKPAMGFAFRTNYEGVEVDPQRLWFLPMLSASNESSLGLRIGIPDFYPEHERQLANAVLLIPTRRWGNAEPPRTLSTSMSVSCPRNQKQRDTWSSSSFRRTSSGRSGADRRAQRSEVARPAR